MIKFIFALLAAGITVSAGSLLWPRLTQKPEPPALKQIRDVVVSTDIGKQTANILGVESDNPAPIDPQLVIKNAAATIIAGVEDKAQQIVIQQAVNQIVNQLDRLPVTQKEDIINALCKP